MSLTYDEIDKALTDACRDRDAYAADLRAAREEVERLRAELAEAQATLANERGEGEPPVFGFAFISHGGERSAWRHEDGPVGTYVAREIDNMGRVRWQWAVIEDRYGTDQSPRFRDLARGYEPTARAAIRAATKAAGGRMLAPMTKDSCEVAYVVETADGIVARRPTGGAS